MTSVLHLSESIVNHGRLEDFLGFDGDGVEVADG